MHRLLIVDDEHHVVDWLAELFMEYPGLELEIFKAYTGMEALNILESMKIDVVLSDIKMPGISGFDLTDKINENWPKARVIFLTGYNEFDYAYKANQYRNVRYLLKTEDDETIVAAVVAAIDSIEEDIVNNLIINKAIDQERLMQQMLHREIILDYIRGKDDKGNNVFWDEMKLKVNLRFSTVLLFSRIKWEVESNSYIEHGKHILCLQQLLEGMLGEKGTVFVLDMDRNSFLCLIQPRNSRSVNQGIAEEHLIFYLKEMLDSILQTSREALNCEQLFLLYDKAVSSNQIYTKYEAMNLVSLNEVRIGAYVSTCSIISERDIELVNEENRQVLKDHLMKKYLHQLQDFLEQGEKAKFECALAHIASMAEKIKSLHYFPAIEVYLSISNMCLSYINRYHFVEKLSFRLGINKLYSLEEFTSWKEAFSYLQKVGSLLFELNTAEQMDRNEAFIERIRKYILENLDGDLSLTNISKSVNYNPSYVSRIFKQMTGVNLFDYINTTRLEFAKNLLTKTQDSIQDISTKIGFESPQYFSTMFKRNVGMAPHEYRNKYYKS